ncbi:hypothetical protein Taro_047560 [Colocasia esculenta]|uniref:F-box/LRR-repeat protein 15-like leucin rich repeat domain-containing protein n=1 Tax=Colocasia esculenta TaxID=4460 RepID=A0A843X188_COLES|nr:hypothetical protein [Colocasia esculenta]
MEEVPEPLLSEILKRIDGTADRNSVSLVSKRFHSAEGEQRATLHVGCGLHPATESLRLLCARFPHLRKLEIGYSGWMSNLGKQLDDRGLLVLPSHCPSLEDLTLSFCSFITDAGLGHLSSCRNLRSLKLNFAPSISSNGLLSVVVGCKKLSTLHLSRCMKVKSSEWLEYLGKYGVLEDLTVKNCRAIGEADVVRLGEGWRKLRRLELEVDANYRDLKTHNQFTADRRVSLTPACDAMEELRLVNCVFPHRGGLSCVLSSSKMLERLSLDRCYGLRDSDMISLALSSVNLRCISLYLPSHFVAPWQMNAHPPQLTDDSLMVLACSCSSLEEIAISFSDVEFASLSCFSQGGILRLIRSCPVRVLLLDRAYLFNDMGMEALSSCCSLEKLELSRCQEVSDEGVQFLQQFPRLNSLTLCKCLGITDCGLKPLLGLKKLQFLTVQDCPQISEEGVRGAAGSVSYRQDLSWLY